MTGAKPDGDSIDSLVRGLVEFMSDSGSRAVPMASTDAESVIKAQLVEDTGAHLLDSGGAYGRHWEENQDNPPWEQAQYDIRGCPVQNVYHHMDRVFGRDRSCVALESALYAFGRSEEYKRTAWLPTQEVFAEALLDRHFSVPQLEALGVPSEFADEVIGIQHEIAAEARDSEAFTCNTYSQEFGALSQCLQGTNIGGPYADYTLLQVHQGCDVRGGYTSPRVYSMSRAWIPMEFSFYCNRCETTQAESCVRMDEDEWLFQDTIDPAELVEKGWLEADDEDHPALERAYDAQGDYMDGAIFHRCEGPIGNFGFVGL